MQDIASVFFESRSSFFLFFSKDYEKRGPGFFKFNHLFLDDKNFVEEHRNVYIVYVIESAAYGVLFTSCLCQKPERARYERVRAFDTNNE